MKNPMRNRELETKEKKKNFGQRETDLRLNLLGSPIPK